MLHKKYMRRTSSRKSDVPIYPLSHSPTPKPPSSASHPHLHTLLHSPTAYQTQSGHLSSSGGSDGAVHSPDYIGTGEPHSHDSQSTLMASQSQSKSPGIDSRPDLTASDSHSPYPAEPGVGHNYVNLDFDELTASREEGQEHKQFRSLSPLEQSIERELEKSHDRSLVKSTGSDYEVVMVAGEKGEDKEKEEPQQYANWQFAQMQEKMQSREVTSSDSSQKPLLNGGPKSHGHQPREMPAAKPHPIMSASIPRKPLKPPPSKSRTLADMTALPSSACSTSPALPMLIAGPSPAARSPSPHFKSKSPPQKSLSASKLQSELTVERNKTTAEEEPDHSGTNVLEIDHFLPSQLSKLRSYTASSMSSSPDKKKPILPPLRMGGRTSVKSQPRFPVVKEIVEVVQERREILESSGELDSSGGSGSGESSKSTKLLKGSATLPSSRTLHPGKTKEPSTVSSGAGVLMSKPVHKTSGQSSPTSELMRKLSLRRQKLEQQLGTSSKHTSASSTGLDGSSRCTSTSSTQSEFVCSYSTKRLHEESPLNSMEESAEPSLRERDGKEEGNLVKYGIEEDVEGGSYVI